MCRNSPSQNSVQTMKRSICFLLLLFFFVVVQAQKNTVASSSFHQLQSGKGFDITSMGRTSALNEKYHIKASVEYVSGTGYILKFSSDVAITKAIMKKWANNSQGNAMHSEQATNFNPPINSFLFNLDSAAYKGGKQYDLLLYINLNDVDYSWRIHLHRK